MAGSATSGYNLTKSLRFRSSASAYLNRTAGTSTNQSIATWSFWFKRGTLGTTQRLFEGYTGNSDSNNAEIEIQSDNTLLIGGYNTNWLITTQLFRDPSAWYHIVVSFDTTQATSSNRIKLYVNGSQVTAFSTAAYPSQNSTFGLNNNSTALQIGRRRLSANNDSFVDGYLTEINFIDGQALTPSSFGSTNALTGVWQPAKYTGTYGTNGFYLPFTNTTSTTTLGYDFSGNSNNWTTNNISLTAGTTYDAMTDVPTLTSATTANYAVMNPLDKVSGTASNGNLTWTASASQSGIRGTVAIPSSGAFYMECIVGITTGAAIGVSFGLSSASVPLDTSGGYAGLYQFYASSSGQITLNNTAITTSLGAFNAGDVLQVAVDATNTKMWLGKNNTWYDSSGGTTGNPSAGTNPTTTTSMVGLFPFSNCYQENVNWNFGQRPFSYTPPTGFVALNTYNLPTSTIVKGNTVMDATTFTGNSSTQSIVNTAGFKPDLVWMKARNNANYNWLTNSVTGSSEYLSSNDTIAARTGVTDALTAFTSTGFTLGANTSDAYVAAGVNYTGRTYVGWQWQAGQGSSSSNTNGSITSTVSVNASSGFSVVTYTGTGANATVGHGLGVAPSMIITKRRSGATENWGVYHISTGSTAGLFLNLTDASLTNSTFWNNTSPTSSVFSVGSGSSTNPSAPVVAYCWSEITGFSKFGSYTGNGSTDGPFVYTNFRPRWIMIKNSSAAGNGWVIMDSYRDTYNQTTYTLYPNSSGAETNNTTYSIDILSNGFKVRASDPAINGSSNSLIYAAFAENPFKNALAR